ncbi:MAG TPA: hypothetical protein VF763_04550 [Candidatus Limnocylindrales bacterium]
MSDQREPDILERLEAAGLAAAPWSNGPGERYAAHSHGYDKVLVVTRGAIVFGLPASGAAHRLGVGERLDLPAGIEHDATVGPAGVTCLEAHLPPGSLGAGVRARGEDW